MKIGGYVGFAIQNIKFFYKNFKFLKTQNVKGTDSCFVILKHEIDEIN